RQLHDRRGLAAADVGDADPNDESPVELEADPGTRPVVQPDAAPVRLEVAGDAPSDTTPGRRGPGLRPESGLDAIGKLGQGDVCVECLPNRERVAALDEVAAPQLERIERELACE